MPGAPQIQRLVRRGPWAGALAVASMAVAWIYSRARSSIAKEPPSLDGIVRAVLEKDQRFFGGPFACHAASVASNSPVEDRYSASMLSAERALFGVYDGHAGWECSDMLARRFPSYVAHGLQSLSVPAALKAAFNDFDSDLLRRAEDARAANLSGKAAVDALMPAMAGSVLATAVVEHNRIITAHAGDCRAIVARRGKDGWQAIQLSHDHDASNSKEIARMAAEHPNETVIVHDRVLGHLQPFRAMGDARYKWPASIQRFVTSAFKSSNYPYRREIPGIKTPPYVTADPEIVDFSITDEDEFLILATDGLWEMLSMDDVVRAIGEFDAGDAIDTNAATHLIREALGGRNLNQIAALLSIPPPASRNYRDDITALVVFLKNKALAKEVIEDAPKAKIPASL